MRGRADTAPLFKRDAVLTYEFLTTEVGVLPTTVHAGILGGSQETLALALRQIGNLFRSSYETHAFQDRTDVFRPFRSSCHDHGILLTRCY